MKCIKVDGFLYTKLELEAAIRRAYVAIAHTGGQLRGPTSFVALTWLCGIGKAGKSHERKLEAIVRKMIEGEHIEWEGV